MCTSRSHPAAVAADGQGNIVDLPGLAAAGRSGDAICAGLLYGIHEGWDCAKSARLGACCAAASLSADGATDGVKTLEQVLAIGKRFPEREPPVKV